MRDLNEEERDPIQDMDVETMAKVIFLHLRDNHISYLDAPDIKWRNFSFYVDSLRHELKNQLFPEEFPHQSDSNDAKFLEAITLLERRGLVVRNVPEQGRGGVVEQFVVYLTSMGKHSEPDGEGRFLVDKPEKIVDELGILDPVVEQYYLESIHAYRAGLYTSSVICLGVASETAIHWLAQSIGHYSKNHRERIKDTRKRGVYRLAKHLSGVIPHIFYDDKMFAGELKGLLDDLEQLYRKNRNEAGHPKVVDQSWSGEDQEILLLQFRRYITTICEAIKRLKNIGNV